MQAVGARTCSVAVQDMQAGATMHMRSHRALEGLQWHASAQANLLVLGLHRVAGQLIGLLHGQGVVLGHLGDRGE